MSFNIGLSGLFAANKQLDVTGNNIANVATTGFKSSRAEFADIYAAAKLGTGRNAIGNGVNLSAVSQQFTQGDVNGSGGTLDMAIQGGGFFVQKGSRRCVGGNHHVGHRFTGNVFALDLQVY